MILRRLLEAMLNFGGVCVMTSKLVGFARGPSLLINGELFSRHPDDLYKNGIQRSSFIPAIELLKSQFEVTDLNSGTGQQIKSAYSYHLPSSPCQTIVGCPALSPMFTTTLWTTTTSAKSPRFLTLSPLPMHRILQYVTVLSTSGAEISSYQRARAGWRNSVSMICVGNH